MIKSKELVGPSCLTNAADNEPIFVLRANDEIAPMMVEIWAQEYKRRKLWVKGGMTPKQRAKHAEAIHLAQQMRDWKMAQ